MSILFIKHIGIEGPGTFGSFLDDKGIGYETVDVFDGAALPEDPAKYGAIVILGGPMNVYEEDAHPYLKDDDRFIKDCFRIGKPMLGLCLGAQLISKASGAKVGRNHEKEIGWFDVELTEDGVNDPLFKGFDKTIEVFQWHGDTFDIPENGAHLASSPLCANQAFRYNENAYGLQFHLEVTNDMVVEWLDAYDDEVKSMGDKVSREKIIERAKEFSAEYNKQAIKFYENFLRIIK